MKCDDKVLTISYLLCQVGAHDDLLKKKKNQKPKLKGLCYLWVLTFKLGNHRFETSHCSHVQGRPFLPKKNFKIFFLLNCSCQIIFKKPKLFLKVSPATVAVVHHCHKHPQLINYVISGNQKFEHKIKRF